MPDCQAIFSGLFHTKLKSKDFKKKLKLHINYVNVLESEYYSLFFLFAQDQEQSTPLHAAAYLGDVHTMDLLIASGRETIYLT